MCQKMAFDTKSDANKYIKILKSSGIFRSKIAKKRGSHLKKQSAYYCDECKKWHLTSNNKLKGNQLKARHKHLERANVEIQ